MGERVRERRGRGQVGYGNEDKWREIKEWEVAGRSLQLPANAAYVEGQGALKEPGL